MADRDLKAMTADIDTPVFDTTAFTHTVGAGRRHGGDRHHRVAAPPRSGRLRPE